MQILYRRVVLLTGILALSIGWLVLSAAPKQWLVERPAIQTSVDSDTLVIFVSGDGGWAEFDQNVSDYLNRSGLPVVGIDSLHYFWHAQTPEKFSSDLENISHRYLANWHKKKLLLVGYSQGADVLPFAISRFPPDLRSHISGIVLLGLDREADFEIHPANLLADNTLRNFQDRPLLTEFNNGLISLLGGAKAGLPVAGDLHNLKHMHGLCIFGTREKSPFCQSQQEFPSVALGGGHHFGSRYAEISGYILGMMQSDPFEYFD